MSPSDTFKTEQQGVRKVFWTAAQYSMVLLASLSALLLGLQVVYSLNEGRWIDVTNLDVSCYVLEICAVQLNWKLIDFIIEECLKLPFWISSLVFALIGLAVTSDKLETAK